MDLQAAGVVWTFPNHCSPLDDVQVVFEWSGLHGQEVCFRFMDAAHREYHRETVTSGEGRAVSSLRSA